MSGVPSSGLPWVRQEKVQERDRVEGSYGLRARRVSIRRKFVVSRNLGYKTRGSFKLALWLNVVLTPGYPSPGVKVHVRDLVRNVGIVAPLPTGGRYPEMFVLSRPSG